MLQLGEQYLCSDIAKTAHEVLKGLAYLHGLGLAHRNIRPENILFSGEGELKLLPTFFIGQ